jgi:ABC-type antimicrobial peptide transport system permease subunit
MDPNLPLRRVSTMEGPVSGELAPVRFFLILLTVFAFIAVALATAGLYGVVAHLVSGRKQEMGIRMALGADGNSRVSMIFRQTARPILMGMVVGLVAAFLASFIPARLAIRVDPIQTLNAE